MTDYGPGHGSRSWRPEPWSSDDPLGDPPHDPLTDPLYGDQAWDDGRGTGGWQAHPGNDPYAAGGYPSGGYPAQPSGGYPAQPSGGYQNGGGYPSGEYPAYHSGEYPTGGYPQAGQAPYGYQDPRFVPGQRYGGQDGGWDTGGQPVHDPGQTSAHGWQVQAQPGTGYDTGQFPAAGPPGQGGTGWSEQDRQDGYPAGPPQAPYGGAQGGGPAQGARQAPSRPVPPGQRRPPEQERTGEPNPFDDEDDEPETHPFFTRGADADDLDDERERRRPRRGQPAPAAFDDDDDDDDRPAGRSGKEVRRGGTKRRGGCACLVAVVALGGVLGGGGYVGYRYYENHVAPPPDYSGSGSGSAEVRVPDSATLAQIGNILKKDGVVESVDAFTKAAAANPKATGIQGGIYMLHKRMSAADAVTMMLDPAAQSALIVPEGWRASQVYAALDSRLGLKSGTVAKDVHGAELGLPSYDKGGDPEGFLYPSRYSAAKGGDPVAILRQMVRRAQAEYTQDDLAAKAAKVGKTPYQIIVIASLIQAEAQQPADFGKVSRVIYNRLGQNMALGFDSTINYAKGRSTLHTTTADTRYASPYNTYLHKGLPPGPIDNPGHQAIEAALHPTAGDWLYFVTVKPGDTRFTASAAQHERNVAAFNAYQREHHG